MGRFCLYHPRMAFVLLLLLILLLTAVFALLQIPLWLTLAEAACLFLGGWGYLTSRPFAFVERATKILREQCDPYPMAQACEEMCTLVRNPALRQIILINLAVARSEMGQYEACVQIMQDSGGEAMLALQQPSSRAIYYNNIASFYIELGRLEEAAAALQKAMDLWDMIKISKQREGIGRAIHATKAELAVAREDYSAAISLVSRLPEDHARALVNKAFLRAKIHLALGEQEAARLALQYVVANANRLHCRVEAEEMLATLNG